MEQQEPLPPGFTSEQEFDRAFRPKGAITFFLLLVTLGLIIWYGIYLIMASRI